MVKATVYVLLVLSGSVWLGARWQVKRGYGRRLQEWYLYIVSIGGLYILEALSVHNYIYISDIKTMVGIYVAFQNISDAR